jgi:4'-phosphopantetheinyl transferase
MSCVGFPKGRADFELKTNHVVLRWLAIGGLDDMQQTQLAGLLSETEQAKAARFHDASHRRTYVAAHALLRGMLAHVTGRDPRELQFTHGPNGKPEPVCPPGIARVCINLSHTHDLAAVAMTLDREVGVDIEWIARAAPFEVMERFFAPSERADVIAAPPSLRSMRFYDFWTMKEAYMKATGQGFSLDPVSFAVALTPACLQRQPSGQTIPTPYFFQRFSVSPGHVGAIALEGAEPVTVDAGAARLPWLGEFVAT